ncbi:MAG: magnesium transporter CorA family protein [Bacillota bacterium]|nr:magnesium transporter CorA family protein [Bacillota bacterium]
MIRTLYRPPGGSPRTGLKRDELGPALAAEGGLLWIDLAGEPPAACEPLLRETFGFHPLAVEDALEEAHAPKLNEWPGYLYAVFKCAAFAGPAVAEEPVELDVFLGRNFLVTYHESAIPALDRVWNAWESDRRRDVAGADRLLYVLVDELAEEYFAALDLLNEALEDLQDQVMGTPTVEILKRILSVKRAVSHLRRAASPQREVLNRLARDEHPEISEDARVYFRDAYDRFASLHDQYENLQDLVTSSLDVYLSVVNNRMSEVNNRLNEVMERLTIVATWFLPASFFVGLFGMNPWREVLADWHWWGLLLFATAVFALPGVFFWWMRRRGWM